MFERTPESFSQQNRMEVHSPLFNRSAIISELLKSVGVELYRNASLSHVEWNQTKGKNKPTLSDM